MQSKIALAYNLVQFSKFLFLQKAYENRHMAKYWVRNRFCCSRYVIYVASKSGTRFIQKVLLDIALGMEFT